MALETATYIPSLVVTNPDGADAKSTADDHLRLLKAVLKRNFPLMDGAVSLSHTQLMRLNDVSASVQLQLNQLRDGTATAANAINARFAESASVARNALSLGGFAASVYPRLNVVNTFTAGQVIAGAGDEQMQLRATNPYIGFYNAAGSTRYGYLQALSTGLVFSNNDGSANIIITPTGASLNSGVLWTASNDGAGSGLDADKLDGLDTAELATGSTVVVRSATGRIFGSYFNSNTDEAENPTVASFFVSSGDGYLRKATAAYTGTQIVTRNISTKAGTAKTLSASSPSGGVDGDFWYQI